MGKVKREKHKNKNKGNNNEQEWYIGIDFGTSNTYITAYEEKEHRFYSQFFSKDLDLAESGIPTVIAVDRIIKNIQNDNESDEITFLIGREALEHASLVRYRDLKQDSRRPDPEDLGASYKQNFGPEDEPFEIEQTELITKFFANIINKIKKDNPNYIINTDTVKAIIIGRPCVDPKKVNYDKVLINGLCDSFFIDSKKVSTEQSSEFKGRIKVVPEPELAGITYLSHSQQVGDVVLVIDAGGGTTDFAVLSVDKKKEIESCKIADQDADDIGGKNIDEVIKKLVSDKIWGKNIEEAIKKLVTDKIWGKNIDEAIKKLVADKKWDKNIEEAIKKLVTDKIGDKNIDEAIKKLATYITKNYKTSSDLRPEEEPCKEECRKCKENIFSSSDKPSFTANGRVKGVTVFYKRPNKDNTNYVILDNNEDYKNILKELCDRLEKGLKEYKNDNPNKIINKVLFVGGTSQIYPLREKMLAVISKFYGNFESIVPSEKALYVKLDNYTDGISITNYNAVAIGACIKAMKLKPVSFPKLRFKWYRTNPWIDLIIEDETQMRGFTRGKKFINFKKETKEHRMLNLLDSLSFFMEINGSSYSIEFISNDELMRQGKECLRDLFISDLSLEFSTDGKQVLIKVYDGEELKDKLTIAV